MGEIADTMINGEACQWCGVYLAPNEKVYQYDENKILHSFKMPKNGEGFGLPVICGDCK